MSLIQDLRNEGNLRPILIEPKEDKVTRMSAQSAKIEAGRVLVPEHAAWLNNFKAEIMAFPNVSHDDQIDSLSQFLSWIEQPFQRRAIPVMTTHGQALKSTRQVRKKRCAIYTHKSSGEGLEQDFNSLDAQREVGEAYVRRQVGDGSAAGFIEAVRHSNTR